MKPMSDHTCPTCGTWWTDHVLNARPGGACPGCTPRVRKSVGVLTDWEKLQVITAMVKDLQGRGS